MGANKVRGMVCRNVAMIMAVAVLVVVVVVRALIVQIVSVLMAITGVDLLRHALCILAHQ